jgi:hypothetical protein
MTNLSCFVKRNKERKTILESKLNFWLLLDSEGSKFQSKSGLEI